MALTNAQTGRVGHFMHTSNGNKYWPLDPRPEEVDIDVIAHHLATRCRYNGAVQHPFQPTRIFYSVAEHSIYVAYWVMMNGGTKQEIMTGLLHDGSEAYNGDLIRPLKYDPTFRAPFKLVEGLNERAVSERFNIPCPFPKIIKRADEAVTAAEILQIVPKNPDQDWSSKLHDDSEPAPFQILMMYPYEAKRCFTRAFTLIDLGMFEDDHETQEVVFGSSNVVVSGILEAINERVA